MLGMPCWRPLIILLATLSRLSSGLFTAFAVELGCRYLEEEILGTIGFARLLNLRYMNMVIGATFTWARRLTLFMSNGPSFRTFKSHCIVCDCMGRE